MYIVIYFCDVQNGNIKSDRITIVKRSIAYSYINLLSAKYSTGYPVEGLQDDLLKAIELTQVSWAEDAGVKFNYEGKYLNQFLEYDVMLWMLSLGFLLNVSNENLKKLVEVIDGHGVKDHLYEFIIQAKLEDRQTITEESYEFGWKLFGKLRQAITEADKFIAEKLVKEFVCKDWYKEHKDTAWYNSHKSKRDTYYGYWSFETATVVKIMGLDDIGFINCPYYPKDLVHQ